MLRKRKDGTPYSPDRRRFLAFGLAGGAVLFLGALGARVFRVKTQSGPLEGFQVLRAGDLAILAALAPAILKSTLPEGPEALQRALRLTDSFLATQSPSTQKDFYRLTGALSVFHSWEGWSIEDADRFLNSYRKSWINTKNHIYCSLLQMVSIPWYGEPEAWKAISYPGPPTV